MSSSWGSFALETLKTISPFSSSEEPSNPEIYSFRHKVVFDSPGLSKEDYWNHVMEPGFDYYVYDRHDRDVKPSERSYLIEGSITRRETDVEVTQDTSFGTIFSMLGIDSQKAITYLSTQQKHNDGSFKIAYQNVFNNGWEEYIKLMNGVVVLQDEPTQENPLCFAQHFTIEMKISFGWNTGTWFSRTLGSVQDSFVTSSIQNRFIEKSNQLPFYFLSFQKLQIFKKT